jgi:S1-C subfamily serine protease
MKTLFLAAILAVPLFFFPISAQQLPLRSVEPIAQVIYPENGAAPYFGNVCTAASINEKQHYWLTAQHCIADEGPHYIAGQPVGYVMKDATNDLAIVSTPVLSVPALKLAKAAPVVRDPIVVIGHPLGQIFPVVVSGPIAAEQVQMGDAGRFMLLQIPGAPGNSGSPVLNINNEIVSVVQRGPSPSNWGSVMASCTFDKLQALAIWWEK